MNYKENTYTSIQCGQLLSMSMYSTCYAIMYNDNSDMYYEPMLDLYLTCNTILIELSNI